MRDITSASPLASMNCFARMARRPYLSSMTAAVIRPPATIGATNRACRNGRTPALVTMSSNSSFSISVFRAYRPAMASRRRRRSITSEVRPAMICFFRFRSASECQILTRLAVATPPKKPLDSISATFAPSRAAATAANTPVQLPPITHTSHSWTTGIWRGGSVIVAAEFFPPDSAAKAVAPPEAAIAAATRGAVVSKSRRFILRFNAFLHRERTIPQKHDQPTTLRRCPSVVVVANCQLPTATPTATRCGSRCGRSCW